MKINYFTLKLEGCIIYYLCVLMYMFLPPNREPCLVLEPAAPFENWTSALVYRFRV